MNNESNHSDEIGPTFTGGLAMDVVDMGASDSRFLCFTCGLAHEVSNEKMPADQYLLAYTSLS